MISPDSGIPIADSYKGINSVLTVKCLYIQQLVINLVQIQFMKFKHILLFAVGLLFLLFGNRKFWENYQQEKLKEKKRKDLIHANDDVVSRFETQKLVFDTITSKWKNPVVYFQTVNLGNVNYKALQKKGKTVIETNTTENASSSQ